MPIISVAAAPQRPASRIHYSWRERVTEDGETFLVYPHSDPHEYEFAVDMHWDTPNEAVQGLEDFNIDPDESDSWVLVKSVVTEEPRP